MQIGDQEAHVVTTDVHPGEIDCRVGQAEDVGAPSARGFHLAQIRYDVLIDQFLHFDSNQRSDEYGETPANMARFALEVVDAVIARIGAERTALRVSPGAYFNIKADPRDREVFDYLLPELEKRNLAYLHEGMFDDSVTFDFLGGRVSTYLRQHYSKTLMGVGGFSAETGATAIENNEFDLLAIGRPFIANPDYIARVQKGEELKAYQDSMLTELY